MNVASFSSSRAKFSTNSVNHRGWAWMSLCLALAAHVFDEAMTDFLSVYNLQEDNREIAFRDTDCVILGGLTLESARASG
jgi:hypothetical protein